MGMGQNLVPLVNIKIAGKWMFIPLKMVLIGIDPYPYHYMLVAVSSPYIGSLDPSIPRPPHRRNRHVATTATSSLLPR